MKMLRFCLLSLVSLLTLAVGGGEGAQVLWDFSHGHACHPIWPTCDTLLIPLWNLLEEEGIFTVQTEAGLQNEDLSQFDALVLSWTGVQETPYTTEEVSLIEDYVNSGRGLLILGEHRVFGHVENLNPVAQRFGVTLGDPHLSGIGGDVTPIIPHPIFTGVSLIKFATAGALLVEPPSIPAAVQFDTTIPGDQIGIAVAEVGGGRVVITGDESVFYLHPSIDCCLFRADNETFARNLFRWLVARPACASFDDLDETIAQAAINNRGIKNSLQSKVNNARKQYERGNRKASGNVLCALLHEIDAQDGKHIDPSSAQTLRDCVQSLAEALGIPLPCPGRSVVNTAPVLESSPNPFSSKTHISFTLPARFGPVVRSQGSGISDPIPVRLTVYDITGRLVKTLVDGQSRITSHESRNTVVWDSRDERGREVPSGIYFYRLTTRIGQGGDYIATKKLILLK